MGMFDGLLNLARNMLGTSNEAVVRSYQPLVRRVSDLEPEMIAADDAALVERAGALRRRLADGASLDDIEVEAYALAREAADRRLGMWKAIADPESGFDAWGDQGRVVKAARERLAGGDAMWDIHLPAAVYARIREAHPVSIPPFRMRAHDVQVLGAAVLHDGRIAEMKTGEGKTLVASLACFLNGLSGEGVHVVTVNDYLARRDADWNRPTFRFLGLTVGAIQSDLGPAERSAAYRADITYGTNNEFGFDYLRDNLKQSREEQVQTRHSFAIVDEVDSVLIDEARTPLIISGPAESHTEMFRAADLVARGLEVETHFDIDLKDRQVTLTEDGISKANELFGVENLYAPEHMHLPHFLDNALKAHHIYQRDKEYLVTGSEVKIVDEFTGRVLSGRRWSDGLHQAIEAKEGVRIQEESQTYATITLQNFFRLYTKLAGMTGTAMTEADEFNAIYKLQVVAVPTNRPIVRRDLPDLIYGSENEKFEAIATEVAELHGVGQPILIGTITVDASERLSALLNKKGIPHNVLNARQHQREAGVVAEAGQFGGVTIATNMAGRGTDIVLGNTDFARVVKHWKAHDLCPRRITADSSPAEVDEAVVDLWSKKALGDEEAAKLRGQAPERVLDLVNKSRREQGWHPLPLPSTFKTGLDVRQVGGLRIIGTERHESRRIDNQLRGRSGRQGDPGSSRFYLSLDDDLMKRFAGPTMAGLMRSLGLKDGIPIESRMVSRAVEKAQKRVEEYHYGMRKTLLEYDQVMNTQRTTVYAQRQQVLEGEGLEDLLLGHFERACDDLVQEAAGDGTRGKELGNRIAKAFTDLTGLDAPKEIPVLQGGDACRDVLVGVVKQTLTARRQEFSDSYQHILRFLLLDTIDRRWKDHLYAMDHLRSAISLEGYGQRDPKMRYKEEGYRFFVQMQDLLRLDLVRLFFRVQVRREEAPPPDPMSELPPGPEGMLLRGGFQPAEIKGAVMDRKPTEIDQRRVPMPIPDDQGPAPDSPCPCGSGRAFRDCHGVF